MNEVPHNQAIAAMRDDARMIAHVANIVALNAEAFALLVKQVYPNATDKHAESFTEVAAQVLTMFADDLKEVAESVGNGEIEIESATRHKVQ